MWFNSARLPRLRWALRHPFQVLDRQGIAPWQAVGAFVVIGGGTAWLVNLYFSIRR